MPHSIPRQADPPVPLRLVDFFCLNELQEIQEDFCANFGVGLAIVDPSGTPLLRPSRGSLLCQQNREAQELMVPAKFPSDDLGPSVSPTEPAVLRCTDDRWIACTPLTAGDTKLATWVIGPVCDDTGDPNRHDGAGVNGSLPAWQEQSAPPVPRMTMERFRQIARHLHRSVQSLSARARQKLELANAKTEQRHLEEELRQAQKLEALGQLASGVAHDFNNILTAQLMHLSILHERPDLPEGVVDSLLSLETGAHMAADLTRQLLAFSRRNAPQIQRMNLDGTVTNLLKMLRRMLGEDIALTYDCSTVPTYIDADPGMIEQVVMNLVVNARDAMPSGGSLLIRTAVELAGGPTQASDPNRSTRHATLTVTDTGCGMDEATLDHMFEPFFTAKESGKGTGLGLATVFGIVQQHRGWIEVKSSIGVGSTFRVFLPLAQPATSPTADTPPPSALYQPRRATILVVEDELSVRQIMTQALQQLGHDVLAAVNGAAAAGMWPGIRDRVQLVITDLIMPGGVNGIELTRQIRQDRPDLPVIVTSGYQAELARAQLASFSPIGFLPKPFQILEFSRLVEETLSHPPGSAKISAKNIA